MSFYIGRYMQHAAFQRSIEVEDVLALFVIIMKGV